MESGACARLGSRAAMSLYLTVIVVAFVVCQMAHEAATTRTTTTILLASYSHAVSLSGHLSDSSVFYNSFSVQV